METTEATVAPVESESLSEETFDLAPDLAAVVSDEAAVSPSDDTPPVEVVSLRLPSPQAESEGPRLPTLRVVSGLDDPAGDEDGPARLSVVPTLPDAEPSQTSPTVAANPLAVVATPGVSPAEVSSSPRVEVVGAPADVELGSASTPEIHVDVAAVESSTADVVPAALTLDVRSPAGAVSLEERDHIAATAAVRVSRMDVAPAWDDAEQVPSVVILEGVAETRDGATETLSVETVASAPELVAGPDEPLRVTAHSDVAELGTVGEPTLAVTPGPLAEDDAAGAFGVTVAPTAMVATADDVAPVLVVASPVPTAPPATPSATGPGTVEVSTRISESAVAALPTATPSVQVAPLAEPVLQELHAREAPSVVDVEVVPSTAVIAVDEPSVLTLDVLEVDGTSELLPAGLDAADVAGGDLPVEPPSLEFADAEPGGQLFDDDEISDDLIESLADDDAADADAVGGFSPDEIESASGPWRDGDAADVTNDTTDDTEEPFAESPWSTAPAADGGTDVDSDSPPLLPEEPPEASFADEPTWPPGLVTFAVDYLSAALELARVELTSAIATVLDDDWPALEDDVELRHEGPADDAPTELDDAGLVHALALAEAENEARAAAEAEAQALAAADAEARARAATEAEAQARAAAEAEGQVRAAAEAEAQARAAAEAEAQARAAAEAEAQARAAAEAEVQARAAAEAEAQVRAEAEAQARAAAEAEAQARAAAAAAAEAQARAAAEAEAQARAAAEAEAQARAAAEAEAQARAAAEAEAQARAAAEAEAQARAAAEAEVQARAAAEAEAQARAAAEAEAQARAAAEAEAQARAAAEAEAQARAAAEAEAQARAAAEAEAQARAAAEAEAQARAAAEAEAQARTAAEAEAQARAAAEAEAQARAAALSTAAPSRSDPLVASPPPLPPPRAPSVSLPASATPPELPPPMPKRRAEVPAFRGAVGSRSTAELAAVPLASASSAPDSAPPPLPPTTPTSSSPSAAGPAGEEALIGLFSHEPDEDLDHAPFAPEPDGSSVSRLFPAHTAPVEQDLSGAVSSATFDFRSLDAHRRMRGVAVLAALLLVQAFGIPGIDKGGQFVAPWFVALDASGAGLSAALFVTALLALSAVPMPVWTRAAAFTVLGTGLMAAVIGQLATAVGDGSFPGTAVVTVLLGSPWLSLAMVLQLLLGAAGFTLAAEPRGPPKRAIGFGLLGAMALIGLLVLETTTGPATARASASPYWKLYILSAFGSVALLPVFVAAAFRRRFFPTPWTVLAILVLCAIPVLDALGAAQPLNGRPGGWRAILPPLKVALQIPAAALVITVGVGHLLSPLMPRWRRGE